MYEGQMYSIGLAMKLRPGAYAEYKRAHDDLWPDLAQGMAENEISMAIYHHGEHLFLHAVAPTERDWEKSREGPAIEKWMTYMATLLETGADGEVAFDELPEAFSFGLFRAD